MTSITYLTKIYNPLKAFAYILPCAIFSVIIVVILSRYFDSIPFIVIGWICICTIPFAFQKKYKLIFTRNAKLDFDDSKLLITQTRISSDAIVNETTIFWEDIKYFKCYFSASNLTFLSVYFKNGSSKTFPFKDQKEMQEAIHENSVFSIFFFFISKFNSTKSMDDQIKYKPALLATRKGKAILYVMLGLYLTAIIYYIIIRPSSSFYIIFIGFFILLSLFIKSKNDQGFSTKLQTLTPRIPS